MEYSLPNLVNIFRCHRLASLYLRLIYPHEGMPQGWRISGFVWSGFLLQVIGYIALHLNDKKQMSVHVQVSGRGETDNLQRVSVKCYENHINNHS